MPSSTPARDVDGELALARDAAGPGAGGTRIVDHLAAPLAGRAGALDREEALLRAHAAIAGAGRAGGRLGARALLLPVPVQPSQADQLVGNLDGSPVLPLERHPPAKSSMIVAQIRATPGAPGFELLSAPRRRTISFEEIVGKTRPWSRRTLHRGRGSRRRCFQTPACPNRS